MRGLKIPAMSEKAEHSIYPLFSPPRRYDGIFGSNGWLCILDTRFPMRRAQLCDGYLRVRVPASLEYYPGRELSYPLLPNLRQRPPFVWR